MVRADVASPPETIVYGSDAPDAPDNFDEYFSFTQLMAFDRIDQAPSRAHARFWQVGPLLISEHRMGRVRAERTADRLLGVPADHLSLLIVTDAG